MSWKHKVSEFQLMAGDCRLVRSHQRLLSGKLKLKLIKSAAITDP